MPDGWAWCRLTNVAITELGKTLDARKNKGEPYDYLCALNVKWYTFDFTTLKQIRLEDKEKERYLVRKGDLLICEGGDVGRAAIWESENPIYYQNALHRVRFYQNINQYFFLHVLNYYKNLGLIDDVSGGVTIKHFTQNSMQKLLFPLPSLAEQDRIVSVIKNIFFQIEVLEQNKSELQDAIKQTKSKILDLAIHGKLVPQNPNDEPAEELLKRIATSDNRPYEKVEEEPFEIPDSWKWVKLGDIGQTNIGLTYHPNDISNTGITVLRSNNIQNDKLCFDDIVKVNSNTKILNNQYINNGDILICARNGSQSLVGKCVLLNNLKEKTSFGAFMAVFRSNYNRYILKYLQSKYFKDYMFESNSTQIHQLTQSMLKDALIPFPPEKEQVRIVAKIDELYSQLDQIQNNLI